MCPSMQPCTNIKSFYLVLIIFLNQMSRLVIQINDSFPVNDNFFIQFSCDCILPLHD